MSRRTTDVGAVEGNAGQIDHKASQKETETVSCVDEQRRETGDMEL